MHVRPLELYPTRCSHRTLALQSNLNFVNCCSKYCLRPLLLRRTSVLLHRKYQEHHISKASKCFHIRSSEGCKYKGLISFLRKIICPVRYLYEPLTCCSNSYLGRIHQIIVSIFQLVLSCSLSMQIWSLLFKQRGV